MELNKIYNTDCIEFMKSMPDKSVDLVITSPPYNKKKNHKKIHKSDSWSNGGSCIDYGVFDDSLPEEEYQKGQIEILNECFRVIKNEGSIFYNHKNRTVEGKIISPLEWILKSKLWIKQEVIWKAVNLVEIDRVKFFPYTERIYWLVKSKKPKFNAECANYGDVWEFPPARGDERLGHPAPYPEELPKRCIISCTQENDLVFDPYSGSGTTFIASLKANRKFIGCEISPKYCDIANKRIEDYLAQQDLFREVI